MGGCLLVNGCAGAGWWGVRHLGLEGLEIVAELLEGVELLAQFIHLLTVHGAECAEHHHRGLLELVEELLLHLFELVECQVEQRRREFTLIRDAVRMETFYRLGRGTSKPNSHDWSRVLARATRGGEESDRADHAPRRRSGLAIGRQGRFEEDADRDATDLELVAVLEPRARVLEALTATPSRPRLTIQTPAAVRNRLQ